MVFCRFDTLTGCLWVISDQSGTIALLSRADAGVLCEYSLSSVKFEGVTAFGE